MATTNVKQIEILNQLSPSYSTTGAIVASGGVSTIAAGTPTKAADAVNAGPWTGAVVPMVDGDGTTAQRFTGVAKSTSTDTASAAGTVDLYLPYPGILYAANAKTASTFDTQAEVDANFGKGVFFDLTSTVWTVDVAASAAQANCVIIVGGDFRTQKVYFNYKNSGTFLGSSISA
jgi:hypothetical protein